MSATAAKSRPVGVPPEVRIAWQANPGPQERFLSLSAYEALYGGQVGGGKSEALLIDALRYVHVPWYAAVIFRRTFPELETHIIERSNVLYPQFFPRWSRSPGARYNSAKHFWRFPSGARVFFRHLEHDSTAQKHQGAEYQSAAFDELTHFTLHLYTRIAARLRSRDPALVPVRLRGSTNPGGIGHQWVKDRFAPWLDKTSIVRAAPGQVLHYVTDGDGNAVYVPKGSLGTLTRVFVPARLADNPYLASDALYAERLKILDPVTRKQWLEGDWDVIPSPGLYFKRENFEIIEYLPKAVRRIRYWDRAATPVSQTSPDPDWTRGGRLSIDSDGIVTLEDMIGRRDRTGAIRALIEATAKTDPRGTEIGIEQDPGQAGKYEAEDYLRILNRYTVKAYPVANAGNKVVRARPVSAQSASKRVRIMKGPWNEAFFQEIEAFPTPGVHDDQVDVLSGGYMALVGITMETADWWRLAAIRGTVR